MASVEDYTSKALEYLQGLSERNLTLHVLAPLFKIMGYDRVDYYGGPWEGGKDIILWRTDELDSTELAVAQVKLWKPTARAADNRSFMEVVNQLQTASEKAVENLDGHKYSPTIVYFITPFNVDTRALQTRFEKYCELQKCSLKIIDGSKLAQLIQRKLPELARDISGVKVAIHSLVKQKLNNQTLLRALDFKHSKNIGSFYSDLDLTFGDLTANILLKAEVNREKTNFNFKKSQWEELEPLRKEFLETHQIEFATFSYSKSPDPNEELQSTININVTDISSFLANSKRLIRDHVSKLNEPETTSDDTRAILQECSNRLSFLGRLIDLGSKIGFLLLPTSESLGQTDLGLSIRIPLAKLSATNLNLTILGDAGAGKTTSLQMQARFALSNRANDLVVIFLPLAQVLSTYDEVQKRRGDAGNIDSLIDALISFLHSEDVDISADELDLTLRNNRSLVLFDGLDEVFGDSDWITSAINLFSEKYSKCQVIVSSRTGGDFLQSISFLGLTLLPFRPEQRDAFILDWFDDEADPRGAAILAHLKENRSLRMVVRRPLLATMLCVLAEHGIPLPKREINLYNERIRLLTGHYDLHKRANRIRSTQNDLVLVAQTLAYKLHSIHRREESIDRLVDWALDLLPPSQLDPVAVGIAVRELASPCNILVPMTYDNRVGFGLLRHQEYLAAAEMNRDRSIDIILKLADPWWRGALVLYSKMVSDLSFLIRGAIEKRIVFESMPTLNAILNEHLDDEVANYRDRLERALRNELTTRKSASSR